MGTEGCLPMCACMQEMVSTCSQNNMGAASGFISKEHSMVIVGVDECRHQGRKGLLR
jgi:hypothetical protein